MSAPSSPVDLSTTSSPAHSPAPSPHHHTPSPLPQCESPVVDLSLGDDMDTDEDGQSNLACVSCTERCTQPRVLSCLHVACTVCLQGLLDSAADAAGMSAGVASLLCPSCSQCTVVGAAGVASLPLDDLMMCLQDMAAVHERTVTCTSCRARENAVARCSDCATFLCPNCVTAHKYMRCFENHKVLSFAELESSGSVTLNRPLFCDVHATDTLKYFCETCQVPICSQCVAVEHARPAHETHPLDDCLPCHASELSALVAESRTKNAMCEEASAGLEGALGELQMQRDNARGLIEETFHSYKAILSQRQEELLHELDSLHSAQELGVMELCHGVERASERTQHACGFAARLLEHGTAAQVAKMRGAVRDQLLTLINNAPRVDAGVRLEFRTDVGRFRQAVSESFGSFVLPDDADDLKVDTASVLESPDTSLDSPTDPVGISSTAAVAADCFRLPLTVLNTSPILDRPILPPTPSSSTDILSDDFIASHLRHVSLAHTVSAQTIKNIASSIQNLHSTGAVAAAGATTMGAVERSLSRSSYSPAMSDSGISVDAASSGSGSNQSLANLAALAKLGTVNVNGHGQLTFDGQVISGLNMNGSNLPSAGQMPPRVNTPPTPTSTQTLANLLSSVGGARSQTPQITELANLLSQSASQLMASSAAVGAASAVPPILGGCQQSPSLNIQAASVVASTSSLNLPASAGSGGPPTPITPVTPSSSSAYSLGPPPPFPVRNNSKMSAMQIRCKFGQLGPGKGQFNSPHGFCLGLDEDIIVADTNNHRIQVFEKTGEFKYQFGIPGREEGQLWYPRKVAVIRQTGKYVVCDRGNERSRMQIFTKNGHFVKKIAIRYIDIVAGLAITQQGHIVAVDSVSPTVFCINETGDLIKWFDCSEYMREPSDIAINSKEYFVCDFKGHCVVVFNEAGQFMRRIGCENITNFPNGIDISDAGDVLIGDSHGNRFHVGVFQRDGSLIGEFECPYVKVSRCCGLKITSEGYVVTLAKNNHHVLVLNTLYIA